MKEMINNTLHRLSITRNYRGYRILYVAALLVLEDEDRLIFATDLYREVSKIINCPYTSVERNIRTVIFRVWKTNKNLLLEMAGYPLHVPPCASEFIDIIVNHVRRTCRISTSAK